jgi:hypothetical protein
VIGGFAAALVLLAAVLSLRHARLRSL